MVISVVCSIFAFDHHKIFYLYVCTSVTIFHCLDVEECLDSNAGCEHNCLNTVGSFYCVCNNGYDLVNEKGCVGECLSTW